MKGPLRKEMNGHLYKRISGNKPLTKTQAKSLCKKRKKGMTKRCRMVKRPKGKGYDVYIHGRK